MYTISCAVYLSIIFTISLLENRNSNVDFPILSCRPIVVLYSVCGRYLICHIMTNGLLAPPEVRAAGCMGIRGGQEMIMISLQPSNHHNNQ